MKRAFLLIGSTLALASACAASEETDDPLSPLHSDGYDVPSTAGSAQGGSTNGGACDGYACDGSGGACDGSGGACNGGGGKNGGGAGGAPSCEVEECIDIEMDKDISFIAVLVEPCPGATIDIELLDKNMTPVRGNPGPHGEGTPCTGLTIDPQALKFEGLKDKHYTLCVRYEGVASPGDIEIVTKAGTTCAEEIVYGECEPCSSGKGGSGACDGSGGSNPCD